MLLGVSKMKLYRNGEPFEILYYNAPTRFDILLSLESHKFMLFLPFYW